MRRCRSAGTTMAPQEKPKKAAGIFALRPTGLKIIWFYKMVDPPFSPGRQRLSQIFMSGESKPWFQPEEHGRCCKTAAHEHHEERKRPPTEAALLLSRGCK